MKLLSLRLENFRQHADSEIAFREGLTGVIGPNGAGKSTILEAIAWAIYGAAAARGTNDTIRFSRAGPRARVGVDLAVELNGHELRVVRSLTGAEVFLDGAPAPVASGIGAATEFMQARVGMTREEFFNTYFTGQKELQFLAQMGPTQRARFLSQVLGYERLRLAQERVRQRRNALRHEADGLRSALPEAAALLHAAKEAEARATAAEEAMRAADAERAAAEASVGGLAPRWESAQQAREQARGLAHAIEMADRDREGVERDAVRAREELDRIGEAAAELESLQPRVAELPDLAARCERHAELARRDERRRALLERESQLEAELSEGAERMQRLEQAPELLAQIEDQLAEQRTLLAGAEEEVERRHREWVETKQDVQTRLRNYRDRARELKEQIRELREAGPDGTCPTCERPLGDCFHDVLGRLEDEWQAIVQDGKWLGQREKQLEAKPEELAGAESERAAVIRSIEERTERHGRCVRAAHELGILVQERSRKEDVLEALRGELEALPAGYDADAHRADEARLGELRELERQAARLEQLLESRERRAAELAEAERSAGELAARIAALEAEHAELAFDEAAYQALHEEHDAASDALRRAEIRSTEAAGQLEAAREARATAEQELEQDRARRAALGRLETSVRHHHDLDAAMTQLRSELNARVRPELSELASSFLAEITDGRYTALEIDDRYNVLVLDEGEEKPVISGGEEDVANLVLRLAISQMIADRAGHPLSILVLDEVFGSLDIERRDNVIQLLHRLSDRFQQVILITHVETVREGLDHVIRVDFDERSGSSRVREETEGVGSGAEVLVEA